MTRYTSEKMVPIDCITLDDFFEIRGWPRIDFVKLDVEGAELACLEGMIKTIRKYGHLRLIVEFFPPTPEAAGVDPRAFLGRLASLDFTTYFIADNGDLRPLNAEAVRVLSGGTPIALNLLCERRVR